MKITLHPYNLFYIKGRILSFAIPKTYIMCHFCICNYDERYCRRECCIKISKYLLKNLGINY
jgi:hypothetical protein